MNLKPQTSDFKITLGYSPCPNDTFIFDAMVHGKIDTEGLQFDVSMEDVETLNQRALNGELEVTKISFAAFIKNISDYVLLTSRSVMGNGAGPLLISNFQIPFAELTKLSVAIPGKNTTANFLFSVYFPEVKNKKEMIFSDIEDAILSGRADAGVIIHENRFTYEQKGLKKICDFGELWENETGQPVPLGGIAVKRNLPPEIQHKINRVLRKSVEFALANPEASIDYVKQHAQEMEESVRQKHIALYVNQYSVELGEKGRKAIEIFFQKALQAGIIGFIPENIFISSIAELSHG